MLFTGHVGAPLPCNFIRLVDVKDMNYFASKGEGEVCKYILYACHCLSLPKTTPLWSKVHNLPPHSLEEHLFSQKYIPFLEVPLFPPKNLSFLLKYTLFSRSTPTNPQSTHPSPEAHLPKKCTSFTQSIPSSPEVPLFLQKYYFFPQITSPFPEINYLPQK